MYITVTLQYQNKVFDISLDNRQRLHVGLQTLRDNQKVIYEEEPAFYCSEMQRRVVSAYRTYEEEQIASGDKLIAVI